MKKPTAKLSSATIIIDARYLERPGMGINVYLQSILPILLSSGAHITLLVSQDITLSKTYDQAKLVVLKSRFKFYWEQVLLPRYLKTVDYDLYYAPANNGLPLFYKKDSHKFMLTVHDLIPLHYILKYWKRPLYILQYLLSTTISVYRADQIIAISNYTAQDIASRFHKEAFIAYSPKDYLQDYKKSSSIVVPKKYFIFNGGVDFRKNVPVLMLGFALFSKKHPDYELVIMGNGHDKHKEFAARKNLSAIKFVGYVSDQEKFNLIRHATALIYVSSMEGFGLPILEAFVCKCLVLCASNSSLPEVAGKAALYVDQIEPSAIGAAMEQAIAIDKHEKDVLLQEAYKRLEYFSSFASTGQFLSVFEKVLG